MLNQSGVEMSEQKRYEVSRLNEGIGYGAGSISGEPSVEMIEVDVAIDDAIEHSPDILVPVDRDDDGSVLDDDGYGDGREVGMIQKGAQILKRSLNRAKVFGGGLTMTVAARIGLGQARGMNLEQTFSDANDALTAKRINYGAHIDEHAHGETCGCGAIDKSPDVVANIVRFEQDIRGTIADLGIEHTESIDDIFTEFRAFATENADKPFSGRRVMDMIRGYGKVVKQLVGPHLERRIVLDFVEGMTVNQELIRNVSSGKAQVFATDVWRLKQLAEQMYPNDEVAQNRMLLSELIYTLGVGATLTDGTLPVYAIQAKPVPAIAV